MYLIQKSWSSINNSLVIVKIFVLSLKDETSIIINQFWNSRTFFLLACGQKQRKFQNWLMIRLVLSFKLKTKYLYQTFQNYPWLFICQWEGSFKLARKLLLFVFPRKVNDSISTLHLKLAIKFWHPRHKVILLCSKGCMYILESYQEGIWTCRDRGKTKEILKLAYRG